MSAYVFIDVSAELLVNCKMRRSHMCWITRTLSGCSQSLLSVDTMALYWSLCLMVVLKILLTDTRFLIMFLITYVHMCNTRFQLLVRFAIPLTRLVWSVPFVLNSANCALAVCVWISWSLDVMLLLCTQTIGTEVRKAMVPQNIDWRRH